MAKKYPFMKWYPLDWLNDTRSLSAAAKGCWMDIICLMWNAPKRGIWEGTYEEFARVTGTPWENAPALIMELQKVSRVTERDKNVTLMCRRIVNLETHYKSNAIRQARYRSYHESNAKVTPKKLEVRSQKSDKKEYIRKNFAPPTPQEATAYAASIGYRLDGEKFVAHYGARGWKYGTGQFMRDWRAAIVTWKKRAQPNELIQPTGPRVISGAAIEKMADPAAREAAMRLREDKLKGDHHGS